MQSLSDLLKEMTKERRLIIRTPQAYSWGDIEQCRDGFIRLFKELDKTIVEYKHLPEYDEVIEWMTDTQGKGLLLMGDCGRGKSIIIMGMIPVLFRLKKLFVHPVHSQDFARTYPFEPDWKRNPDTNLDYLQKTSFPIVDDLGVESQVNEWGERSEGFNRIINNAERYLHPLFVSTNLKLEEIVNRYGERTIDRLSHLCKVITFNGESLR